MTPGATEMARRFALQHIGYWRKAPEPKSRAYHRKNALIWLLIIRQNRLGETIERQRELGNIIVRGQK